MAGQMGLARGLANPSVDPQKSLHGVGQAFQPNTTATWAENVRLESLTYGEKRLAGRPDLQGKMSGSGKPDLRKEIRVPTCFKRRFFSERTGAKEVAHCGTNWQLL